MFVGDLDEFLNFAIYFKTKRALVPLLNGDQSF